MPLLSNANAQATTASWYAIDEDSVESVSLRTYISYFPDDTPAFAKGLNDWLLLRYGEDNVIIDMEIPPFVNDAAEYLRDYIGRLDVMFVLIGPQWEETLLNHYQENEQSRIFLEIKAALDEGVMVAPLCIRGALPPMADNLPDPLKSFADSRFTIIETGLAFYDTIANLIETIKRELGYTEGTIAGWTPELEKHYQEFMHLYHAGEVFAAYDKLQDIDVDAVPAPFRSQLTQYIRKVFRQVQIKTAEPYYEQVRSLLASDPSLAWRILSRLFTLYPEYGDPDGLLYVLNGATDEALELAEKLYDETLAAVERQRIGLQLANGDPRYGVNVLPDKTPDISWVRIPEGSFVYYFDKEILLPQFYISRYPITYQQFQAFIADGGYENEEWWEGLAWREPEPSEQQWQYPNYPRERISWFDAVAFCRWLTAKKGYTIRLPKEEEWEKATRGTYGRIYPWGEAYITGYANINEVVSGLGPNYFRQTVAVGLYPQAASPYGVEDTIGNVWEWCLNAYDKPSYTGEGGTFKRVVRGGCWDSDRLFAHAARRRGELPGARLNIVGFRVVAEYMPPIESLFR